MSDQFGPNITSNGDGTLSIDGHTIPGSSVQASETANKVDKDNKSVNPLSTTSTTNEDGSVTTKNADGTSVTAYGDKSTTKVNADGSKTVTNADGSTYTVAAPPANDATLKKNDENVTNPTLTPNETVTPVAQTVKAGEIVNPNDGHLYKQPEVKADTAATSQAAEATPTNANTYNAATVGNNAPTMTGANGQVTSQDQVTAATQQSLSPALKKTLDDWNSTLASVGVDPNATVAVQYAKLTDFSNGVPQWAQGAMTQAQQVMASRGLGNSSVAGGAITTAILQAALPIAQQDAQVFKDFQLQNLNQKQASVFLQAGYIANMDATNLSNNQQANVLNAQNFMQMDLSNLNNNQQAAVINTQSRLQAMLSDQSAINTAQQFNATSKNQTDQFYSNLNSTIRQFNTAQANGMAQFNTGQVNSIGQFNFSQDQQRAEFNATNSIQIEQANATYLRNVNTANTAATNSANLVNTQNMLNISNTAMANNIQLLRDNASYSFQSGQNALDRAQQQVLLSAQNQNWFQQYNQIQSDGMLNAIGGAILKVGANYLNNAINGSGTTKVAPNSPLNLDFSDTFDANP